MKLIKDSVTSNWIILDEVNDNDAAILRAIGWDFAMNVDADGYHWKGSVNCPYELWINRGLISEKVKCKQVK